MNHYWHMMKQVTLSDRKKEEIMEMLENKDTRRRRRLPVKVLVLAAALAIGCALSIAAGLPAQIYGLVSGGSVTVAQKPDGGTEVSITSGEDALVVLEDGRLWFTADGQKLDITDLIDEDTPYIYERTDPVSNLKGYVIAGGRPEVLGFGWAEYFPTGYNGEWNWSGWNCTKSLITLDDGTQFFQDDLEPDEWNRLIEDEGHQFTMKFVYPGWHQAAREEFGITEH